MAVPKRRQVRAIATSRLTSKSQATVPAGVRKRLNLKPGDTVIFEVRSRYCLHPEGRTPRHRISPRVGGTLSESNSDNDDRAYRDL
jgi:antitoxin PrlF